MRVVHPRTTPIAICGGGGSRTLVSLRLGNRLRDLSALRPADVLQGRLVQHQLGPPPAFSACRKQLDCRDSILLGASSQEPTYLVYSVLLDYKAARPPRVVG